MALGFWPKDVELRQWTTKKRPRNNNNYKNKLLEDLNTGGCSSKDWWTFLKQLQRNVSDIYVPPLKHNNHVITDNVQKSEIFNAFFVEHSTLNIADTWDPGNPPDTNCILNDIDITSDQVFKILLIDWILVKLLAPMELSTTY